MAGPILGCVEPGCLAVEHAFSEDAHFHTYRENCERRISFDTSVC